MSARESVTLPHTGLCALLAVLLWLAACLCNGTSETPDEFVQKELRCIEAVILAKITETSNVDPNALLSEVSRLQKRPAGCYRGRCTENFVWVHGIQHQVQSSALESRIREALDESRELIGEITKLHSCGAGVFHRGCVSEYPVHHRRYFDASTRNNKHLAMLQRACLVIIAETFHRRYESRDIFDGEEHQECVYPQSHLEEVVGRLSEYMSEFARKEDFVHLIGDLIQIELEYHKKRPWLE